MAAWVAQHVADADRLTIALIHSNPPVDQYALWWCDLHLRAQLWTGSRGGPVDPRWTTSGPPLVIPSTLIDRTASATTASPDSSWGWSWWSHSGFTEETLKLSGSNQNAKKENKWFGVLVHFGDFFNPKTMKSLVPQSLGCFLSTRFVLLPVHPLAIIVSKSQWEDGLWPFFKTRHGWLRGYVVYAS